jgi:arylsulfatase A-like enzyme
MSDDHGAQAMSCYGSVVNTTPNLDRLATEGMLFQNCFCGNAICGPSRATIITGTHSHVNGMRINEAIGFDASQETFPKLLRGAGYQTAMIGKWHLGDNTVGPSGFDYHSILPGQGAYVNPAFIEMGVQRTEPGYVTDIITDKAIAWLENRDQGRPFCLLYQHKAPHAPWEPDNAHGSMYDAVTMPEPATFWDDYATRCDAAATAENKISTTRCGNTPGRPECQ